MRERVIDWVCAHKLIVVAFILLALILNLALACKCVFWKCSRYRKNTSF